MRRFALTVALSFVSFSVGVSAQPAIEHLNFTEDGYLEIHGRNFGSKPEVRPLLWLSFEGENPSLVSRYQSNNRVNGTVVGDPKDPANKVLTYDARVSGGSGGPENTSFDSDRLYINLRRYYDFQLNNPTLTASTGGLNLKVLRLWTSFEKPHINNIYLGYQGKEGLSSGRIVGEYTDDKTNWLGSQTPFVGFKWTSEEVIYRAGDIDQYNGVFQYIRDGRMAKSEGERTRTSERPLRYTKLYFDQVSNYTLSHPLKVYYDDIYVDDTYSRVVIKDSSASNAYTRAIPQVPVEWRNDYIKVKLHTAERGEKEIYVYVYNANNQSNSKGFRACPQCPKAPQI